MPLTRKDITEPVSALRTLWMNGSHATVVNALSDAHPAVVAALCDSLDAGHRADLVEVLIVNALASE